MVSISSEEISLTLSIWYPLVLKKQVVILLKNEVILSTNEVILFKHEVILYYTILYCIKLLYPRQGSAAAAEPSAAVAMASATSRRARRSRSSTKDGAMRNQGHLSLVERLLCLRRLCVSPQTKHSPIWANSCDVIIYYCSKMKSYCSEFINVTSPPYYIMKSYCSKMKSYGSKMKSYCSIITYDTPHLKT